MFLAKLRLSPGQATLQPPLNRCAARSGAMGKVAQANKKRPAASQSVESIQATIVEQASRPGDAP